jgi:hypothetical protein
MLNFRTTQTPDYAILIPEDSPTMRNYYEHLFYWHIFEDNEVWRSYYCHEGETPSEKDLEQLKGVIITGSFRGANDDLDFVHQLNEKIQ